MKRFHLALSTLLIPATIYAFIVTPSPTHRNTFSMKPLFQEQQAYYNEADGQYYYYNEGDGNYYTEEGQMYIEPDQYQQQMQEEDEEPSLLISNNMDEELIKATIGTEFGGLDYLALARQRAEERRESNNSESTNEEWINLAEEVQRKREERGEVLEDDGGWEASLGDEGNEADMAGLGMGVKLEETEGGMMVTEGGLIVDNVEGGDDGPSLLL